MGTIQVPGRLSGRTYTVDIAGDAPTPAEQARILSGVTERENRFAQRFAGTMGRPLAEPDDGTALGRGFELGKSGAYSRLGTAAEYLGQGLGSEGIAALGQRMRQSGDYETLLEQLRQPAPTRREDVTGIGSALTYVGEGIGQSGPEMLAPLAASAVGTIVGGPVIGLGAGVVTAFPTFFGGNIQRQEDEVAAGNLEGVDVQGALVSALGQSALNSVGDKLLLGGFLKPGQKWLTRTAVGFGEGAAVEIPTEIAQQMLERRQAGLALDSDDAISEYIDAGILGGIMGGGVRGTTALLRGSRGPAPTPPPAAAPPGPTGPEAAPASGITTNPVVADASAFFEERAAIIEEGDGLSRDQAEAQAARMTLDYLDTNGINSPVLRPFRRALEIKASAQPDMGPPTPPMEAYAEEFGAPSRQEGLPLEPEAAPAAPTAALEGLTQRWDQANRNQRSDTLFGGAAEANPAFTAVETAGAVIPAHGMAKAATLTQATRDLVAMLRGGIKPGLYTDSLTNPTRGTGGATGTSGGTAYRDGSFIITFRKGLTGSPTAADVTGVLVNPAHAEVIPELRALFPDIAIESYTNVGRLPDVQGAPTTQETQDADVRSEPVGDLESGDRAGVTGGVERGDVGPAGAGVGPAVTAPLDGGAVGEPVLGVSDTDGPAGPQPDTLTAEPTAYDPMTGATPGAETGTAGQIIPRAVLAEPPVGAAPQAPAPVTPKTADEMVAAASADPAMDRVVNQFVELQQQAEAKQSIAAWFNSDNTSADLKFAEETAPPGERETTALPAADLRKIDALLRTVAVGDGLSPAQAALRYFGRVPDPGYAFNMIASDAAYAKRPKGKRDPDVKTRKGIAGEADVDLSPKVRADVALEVGQGWKTGQAAETWIFENLSSEAGALFISLRDGRATATKAGYSNPTYDGHKADSAKGKRAGIGRTVDELTDAELEVRKAKVEADRRAMDEEARVGLGFTPQQWNSMDETTRREHVLDYQDLAALGPRVAPVPFNTLAEAPQTATPKAPGARRRAPRDDALDLDAIRAELEVEAEVAALDLGPLSFSNGAGLMSWPGEAHPRASALLRAGDVRGALGVLARTAGDPTHRRVAEKLLARIGDTRSQVVSPEIMDSIRAELSPETPTLGVGTPPGVYVHPRNETQLAAMRREGHDTAADLLEQYGGQILFNEGAGISPELALHEAFHAVADGVLTNKSHPLTRQLDTLRVELLKVLPATHYGLSNVRELMAEGLNNPVFRRDLGSFNVEGQPFSAFQRFRDIVGNWLRGVIGMQPKKRDSAETAVDRALDAILAVNPNEMGAADIANASFSVGGSKQYLKDVMGRARVPTKADLESTRKVLQNTKLPVSWKGTLLQYAVPIDYVADMALRYIPSARRVHGLIGQHQRAISEGTELVVNTTEETAKVLVKYARQQRLVDIFNNALYMATRFQVDPRKLASAYKGYSFQYNVLDKDGNIVRRVESKRYASEAERNKALEAYNAALSPERKTNRIARARRAFDESPETTADHKRVRDMMLSMPADLQKEFSRMLEMQPAVGKGYIEAIRTQIETLLPKDKALQDRIFGTIYDKILSELLLNPYLSLGRNGPFRLSYSAIDPLSISTDPVTGAVDMSQAQVAQFKHSFESEGERQSAIAALQALPATNQVTNITPYQDGNSGFSRQEVPLEFVSRVLDAVDSSGTLAQAVDPATGATNDVRQQIINLMLDSVPETSFINDFKKRQGIRGFRGDATPISEPKAAGDVLKNLRENAMRIARKTADLKYGAEFAAVRKAINDENIAFQGTNPAGVSVEELSRQRAEANQYAEVLTGYTKAPFNVRSNKSRFLGAGTHMLTLGFNVSTALVTLSQIPLFVYPVLAGKYSDTRAMGAIGAAHRILTGASRERTIERIGPDGQIETDTASVPILQHSTEYSTLPYLAPLIEFARKNGVFNRSLMQDELLGEQATMPEKISAATGILQHQAERYSRETALNAAYILELQDLMGRQDMSISDFVNGLEAGTLNFTPEQAQAAAESAVNVSEKSNGPIYAAAGPLASQGNVMSLVYMFKRHPLAMLNLLAQTASRGLGSSDPEDAKIARRQLVRMFGSLAVFSGAMGLPLIQQVGWLYDLLIADDDEPDFKSQVRMSLGEAGAFGLVDYMTGTKTSERISPGSAIYRPGFASQDAAPLFQVLEGVGGPVLGMALKYTSGRQFEDLQNGDYQRAAEGLLPTSIANFFKAVRFAQEGIETRRGDLMDDIGPFHIAAQAFGFMPVSYEQKLSMNSLGTRINNAINTEKSRLMQKIHKARDEGDFDTVQELMAEVQEFNQRNPRNGIDRSTLQQSYDASKRVTAQTSHGLYVAPGNRARVQEYLDAYGRSSVFD